MADLPRDKYIANKKLSAGIARQARAREAEEAAAAAAAAPDTRTPKERLTRNLQGLNDLRGKLRGQANRKAQGTLDLEYPEQAPAAPRTLPAHVSPAQFGSHDEEPDDYQSPPPLDTSLSPEQKLVSQKGLSEMREAWANRPSQTGPPKP